MPTRVGAKGQIVIEKEIRDRLGIRPGAVAVQAVVGDRVEIRFVPPPHERSLFASLADQIHQRPGARSWDEIRQQAWQSAMVREHADHAAGAPAAAKRRSRRMKRGKGR